MAKEKKLPPKLAVKKETRKDHTRTKKIGKRKKKEKRARKKNKLLLLLEIEIQERKERDLLNVDHTTRVLSQEARSAKEKENQKK